jgi:hypothetical protein
MADDEEAETVDGEPVTRKAEESGGAVGLLVLIIVLVAGVLFGGNRNQ